MNVHRIETTISQDRILTITDLPFQASDAVEVIVLESSLKPSSVNPYPLGGKPLRYDAPTEPVAEAEYNVMQ
ncbi:MAG: hypothetical protein H0T63_01585 [Pyrinomonadaceae bacterium]|nr:hypothetical protein [Pyrinomonadaceae bacterium]